MGSEMCIRDSAIPERSGVKRWFVRDQDRLAWGDSRAEMIERFPCLLYTSDAADERSSVDLGGRRIINKQTNGPHYARSATDIEIVE